MVSAKQRANWARFAAMSRRKAKKAKASRKTSKRTVTTTVRRRKSRASPARRVYRAARSRVYRRSSREFVLPAVDLATGIAFGDGMCGNGKRVSATLINVVGGAVGMKGMSIQNGIDHAETGAKQFLASPVQGLINGIKEAAPVLVYRWGAKKLGIPKSVRIIKGFRIQVR